MKKLTMLFLAITFISCQKEIEPKTCPNGCEAQYYVSSSNAELRDDGYWYVRHIGLNYFTIKGNLTQLDPEYVINGVPLIEAAFDSDYWIIADTVHFVTPMYSYLGWFSDNNFQNPIPIGNHVYDMTILANKYSPLNIVGYQLSPYMCWTCPYTETLLGTYSKYNYNPTQNIIFDNEMIGDTAHIHIRTTFNTDLGPREVRNETLNIIFE
jgi:hypothetical protein